VSRWIEPQKPRIGDLHEDESIFFSTVYGPGEISWKAVLDSIATWSAKALLQYECMRFRRYFFFRRSV